MESMTGNTPMRSGFARRSRLRSLLVLSAAGILVLLGFEGGLRLAGQGGHVSYLPDPDLLWVPAPSQQGRTVIGGLPETYNAAAFRYPVDFPRAEPDKIRVFTFGDSVTMGWGVDDHSHYSAVLERRLQEAPSGISYRVVSAGVNAYPTFLCVRRFSNVLEEGYDVNVAVLASSFNQSFESLETLDGDSKQAFLRKVKLKSFLRRSAIYSALVEGVLRMIVYYPIRDRLVKGSWDVDVENTGGLDRFVTALEQMKAESDRHGVKLILLLLGSQGQKAELNEHQQATVDFAQRRGVPLVNMIEVQQAMDHQALYIDHVHPSAKGHVLIADALLDVVRAEVADSSWKQQTTRHSVVGASSKND